MYPAELQKNPTYFADSSHVLAKCIRQKQTQIIMSVTKQWDKKIIEYNNTGLSQTKPRSPLNVLIARDNFIQIDFISVIKHLFLNARNS